MKLLAPSTAPVVGVAPPVAGFDGDVVRYAGHVGHRDRDGPGRGCGLVRHVRQLTRRVGGDFKLAGLLHGRLARARRGHGACQQPGVRTRAVGRLGDVGRDVADRRPVTRLAGMTPSRLGNSHLVFDHAADRVALEPFGDARAEGFVEVGADDALRVRARQRVTGAALGDERLLALDQVGVVGALDRAAGRAQREREQQPADAGEQAAAARAPAGGGASGVEAGTGLMSGRNTIRRGRVPRRPPAGPAPRFTAFPNGPIPRAPQRSRRARRHPRTSARARSRRDPRASATAARDRP